MAEDVSTLPHLPLGGSPLRSARIGLGCMSLSGLYGPSDDATGLSLIAAALDMGVNMLDSADAYGNGQNETLVGQAIKGRRGAVLLATKFGQKRTESGGNAIDGAPAYVRAACDASLTRLGIETIDLYYQHRVDPNVPIEDTVGTMADLVTAGKVRFLGLSEARPETIRRAHAVHPITAVQLEYSLLYRSEAEEVLAVTRELGIAFVAYAPLGRSLLTGTIASAADVANDRRSDHPRFHAENLAANRKLVAVIEDMAQAKGCTPAQVALAWLLAKGDDIFPIPGTRSVARLQENLGALEVRLSADDVAALDAAFPPGAGVGERYPAGAMKAVICRVRGSARRCARRAANRLRRR